MKKIHVRILSVLSAAALLAGALSACGGQQQAADPGSTGGQTQAGGEFTEGTSADRLAADTTPEEEKYGGTMRLNFNGATNSLDPAQFFTNQNYVPGYHIYESPVQVADDGTVWAGVCDVRHERGQPPADPHGAGRCEVPQRRHGGRERRGGLHRPLPDLLLHRSGELRRLHRGHPGPG